MKTLSLTARISLLFAGAASLVLLITGFFLTQVVEAHFKEEDRHELHGKLELVQNLFKHAYSQNKLELLPQRLDDALVGHPGLAVVVTDVAGGIWFATSGADFPRALLQACQTQSKGCAPGTLQECMQAGRSYRSMAETISADRDTPYTVVVAQDILHHERFMSKLKSVLVIAITLAAFATAGLGWIATRWGLSPLREVTDMWPAFPPNVCRIAFRLQACLLRSSLLRPPSMQC